MTAAECPNCRCRNMGTERDVLDAFVGAVRGAGSDMAHDVLTGAPTDWPHFVKYAQKVTRALMLLDDALGGKS